MHTDNFLLLFQKHLLQTFTLHRRAEHHLLSFVIEDTVGQDFKLTPNPL